MNSTFLKKSSSFLIGIALSAGMVTASFAQTKPAPKQDKPPQVAKKENDLAADKKTERGWFFFEDPVKPAEPEEQEVPTLPPPTTPSGLPPPPKEEACKKKETWTADCGFVDPGEDFSFQEKQRDAIMEKMVMTKNSPKAVEAFQYYMRWVMDRASEVGNYWVYNAVQNPDLDPSVKAPISTFGLRLVSDISDANDKRVFQILKEDGAFLLYFSKDSCAFCHHMKGPLTSLEEATGLEIKNISLEGPCLDFIKGECMLSPAGDQAAMALNVKIVPTLFLYIRPNTWIRLATGVVDTTTIKNRAVQFFSAYKSALTKGMANTTDGKPTMDFSSGRPTGTKDVKLPTQQEIEAQLGKK